MTLAHPSLTISQEELAAFCKRWGIKELALFGSAARGEMRPDSDYDFMVEFEKDAHIGLWEFVGVQQELVELLGRPVDLVGKGTIRNPYRRASIERDLSVVYAA
jgi:predicted nucleotidyltransferase